jgi:hypothetical protein
MKKTQLFFFVSIAFLSHTYGQEFSTAIEDNSYLIEEAYNQEDRVVQHIFNLQYAADMKDRFFAFTQEWPVGSQKHQLSYTIPYYSYNGAGKGVGDILINYRYQLSDTNAGWGFVAPRLSLILPTGSTSEGVGSGSPGFQVNFPLSKRWTNAFVTHFNAGITSLLRVEGTDSRGMSFKKDLISYGAGASLIYLAEENFNLMLEVLFNRNAYLEGEDVAHISSTIINPGFRFAINAGTLQIVPGVAMPVQFSPGSTDVGVFGYLSFEHPF